RGEPERAAEVAPELQGARMGTVSALGERMREVLLRAQFLNPQAPEHVLRELERSLLRAELTQREAELWLTAFKHVGRMMGGGKGPSEKEAPSRGPPRNA
ncbi:MAG TPA: hypothetical protein VF664_05790, partial [Cystobacter sp.]